MDDLDAVRDARALLGRAHDSLRMIRARAPGLTAAMRWRSRSAVQFVDALDEWLDLLTRIDAEIDRWDAVLARMQDRAMTVGGAG